MKEDILGMIALAELQIKLGNEEGALDTLSQLTELVEALPCSDK